MYWPTESKSVKEHFDKDMRNVHLLYDYAAKNPETGGCSLRAILLYEREPLH